MKKLSVILLCLLSCLSVAGNVMEDEFFALRSRFASRDSELKDDLQKYLKDYPYTTYFHDVELMIGVIQTENKQYKQALRAFKSVDWKQLGRNDQPMFFFYRGYAFMQSGEADAAMSCFEVLKESNNPYTLQGKYYYAYCQYKQGHYDTALQDFLDLEMTEQYGSIVPYYIIQIYYAKGEYDEVWQRAKELLEENPDNANNAEVYRILGEMYYNKGKYAKATENFEQYASILSKKKKKLMRNDLYIMGIAYYKQKRYDDAIRSLKQVKQEKDAISENTCLHLGHAYVKTEQWESAKLAYSAAMNFRINDKTREEAMYNYALTTHRKNTALGESVTAFNNFLKEYPKTEHATEVYQLLADVYMNTKNYTAALEAVNAIPKQTDKTEQIKQFLRYQIGVDAFLQGKMQDTEKWMTEVIEKDKSWSSYKTDAYYYRAEARYRLHQYEDCYNDLKVFRSAPGNKSGNLANVDYLMGYSLFSLKQYSEAEVAFRRYVKTADKKQNTYADAMNRIGDCCFNHRAFKDAIAAYKTVVEMKAAGADYAMFQTGYAQGLLHQYSNKSTTMEQLVSGYPKSDYADDALYEIARANLQDGNEEKAINAYNRLISDYPNSSYASKASLERAMVYRDAKKYDEAIAGFKSTIEKYAGSDEAYSALDGLEQIYVETNNISEYLAYVKQTGKMKTTATAQEDSLTYVAAELQYMLGNYKEAAAGMTTYLSRYCAGGRYCTVATYQAADSYYHIGKQNEAIELYTTLMDTPGNPYMEETCTRLAELLYEKKEYEEARKYFAQLHDMTAEEEKRNTADLGELRCSYFLKDSERTLKVANRMLEKSGLNENVRDEALYNRAQVYYSSGEYGKAAADFAVLSQNVRVVTGAESAYLLADCYYRLEYLDKSENEIMTFAGKKTQHQYWLAKSLILLSDINVKRGDLFQAKQYLLSLQSNYKAYNDDIQQTIIERLDAIQKMEDADTTGETIINDENTENEEEETR